MILFYAEFNNGDSNCYQGNRTPTLTEANVFCKEHIESNEEWERVVEVGSIDQLKAEGLWDLSRLKDKKWPVFNGPPLMYNGGVCELLGEGE